MVFAPSGLKTGINFAHFGLKSGMVFQGTTCKGEKRTYLSRKVIKKRGPGISRGYFHRKIEENIERNEFRCCLIPRLFEILVTAPIYRLNSE